MTMPLITRLSDITDSILEAAEYLVADGFDVNSDDHEHLQAFDQDLDHLINLISPVDSNTGDPLDQGDYDRAREVISELLRDAVIHFEDTLDQAYIATKLIHDS